MSSDDEKETKEARSSKTSGDKKKSIRKRLGLPKKSKDGKPRSSSKLDRQSSEKFADNNDDSSIKLIDVNDSIASDAASASMSSAAAIATSSGEKKKDRISRDARRIGKGVMKRVRSISRSRGSRRKERSYDGSDTESSDYSSSSDGGSRRPKSTVVTVTSCRSDGYYNQKAPGSTSKLPRKAPTNLKLFHELAVGLKDAFTAVGQTPTKPEMTQEVTDEATGETRTVQVMSDEEFAGRTVLWDFMGNIDFVRNDRAMDERFDIDRFGVSSRRDGSFCLLTNNFCFDRSSLFSMYSCLRW
jgi:hypothetical protein